MDPLHIRDALRRAVAGTALIGLVLAAAGPANATGFRTFSLSTAGMGLANAMGADAEHTSSMAYNPSALAFQEGLNLEAGGMRLGQFGTNEKLERGSRTTRASRDLYLHNAFATYRAPAWDLGTGLSVTRPFRMDSDWSNRFSEAGAATRTLLDLVKVSPTLAYRLRPDLAVAVGGDYYNAYDFEYSSVASGGGEIVRQGDGDAWGGTAGIMFWREGWSVAATYTSGAELELSGKNLDEQAFRLPGLARVGLKMRPSLGWSIHLGAVRTDWSRYEGLEGVDSGKDWSATVGYRLGAMLRLSDRARLRFGYSYDEDPKDEATFDPRSPSGTRHMLTLGGGWDGDILRYNLAYGYAFHRPHDVSGAAVGAYDGRIRSSGSYLLFSLGYSSGR